MQILIQNLLWGIKFIYSPNTSYSLGLKLQCQYAIKLLPYACLKERTYIFLHIQDFYVNCVFVEKSLNFAFICRMASTRICTLSVHYSLFHFSVHYAICSLRLQPFFHDHKFTQAYIKFNT